MTTDERVVTALITDPEQIAALKAGSRAVSVGYTVSPPDDTLRSLRCASLERLIALARSRVQSLRAEANTYAIAPGGAEIHTEPGTLRRLAAVVERDADAADGLLRWLRTA